tara:strand:+ start:21 stop:251 length:231 start_codon:yes stop_codon:yes gene_type:complete
MAMSQEEILSLLKEAFPDAEITLQDYHGDNDHYALDIKSACFKGLNRVQQHQLVYKAIGPKMGKELHALTLKTGSH